MRILLVEDEPDAARMIAKGLREEAYAVDIVGDGETALFQAAVADYDAIVLDVRLPRKSGLEVCRTLRQDGASVPILMLTARDSVEARIEGLDGGADDYLTKPFDFGELLARRPGQVVGRAEISEHVWDENYDPFSNVIEVYVRRLRSNIVDCAVNPVK